MEAEVTQVVYACSLCGAKYMKSCNLSGHMKTKHNFSTRAHKAKLICPLCFMRKEVTYKEIKAHLIAGHNLCVEYEEHEFDGKDAFFKWKEEIETKSKSYFRMQRSNKVNQNKYSQYVCHRSGVYSSNVKGSTRQRQMKVKGTNKIGFACPARIKVTERETGKICILYIKTHVCHQNEIGRTRLIKSQREEIAEKLLRGIPNHRVLKDIAKDFNPEDRLSYTTNKDIHNMKKAYNIQADVIFHPDDAKSVDILVNKYQSSNENPVLAYKPYGVEDDVIGKNNFFLVFMNSGQHEMLSKYGNNVLMVDSTHGTNPYNFQLTTLMIIDNDFEGFPVAFLWSKLQNESIFRRFFSLIKEKIPELNPKVFLSDDTNTFYNAFCKEYNKYPVKIICDWHVKKNLFENLSKIVDLEKRKQVKKQIKLIINELDENTFLIECSRFVKNLLEDPVTEKYGQYFATYYVQRSTQWAHCYRKNFQKNTNMSLEKWHQELKYNSSVGGKCQQRLDLGINNVVECLRTKFLKRLVSICRNKIPYKLGELRKRHKMAVEIADKVDIFEEISNVKWQVASSKNKSSTILLEFYTVTVNKDASETCTCNFLCQECQTCIHIFSCTCHDYSIQFNMCKHIHLVNINYPKSNSTDGNMVIANNNAEELVIICKELESKKNNRHTLEKAKELFKNKITSLSNVINQCQSAEVIAHVNENLTSLLSRTYVLSEPHQHKMAPMEKKTANQKIEHQIRSFDRVKRKKKEKKIK